MRKSGILVKSDELRFSFEATDGDLAIGIDIGDRFSQCFVFGPDGAILTQRRVRTTSEGLSRHFQQISPTRIALNAGTHSGWMSICCSNGVMR